MIIVLEGIGRSPKADKPSEVIALTIEVPPDPAILFSGDKRLSYKGKFGRSEIDTRDLHDIVANTGNSGTVQKVWQREMDKGGSIFTGFRLEGELKR